MLKFAFGFVFGWFVCGYSEVKLLKCNPKSEHLGHLLSNGGVMLTPRRGAHRRA